MTAIIALLFSLNVGAQNPPAPENGPAQNATADLQTSVGTSAPAPATSLKNYANRDINTGASRYKMSYFSIASARVIDVARGGASVNAYNYFGISYKLDQNSQVGFRYVFYSDTPGFKFNISKLQEENVGFRTDMGDPYFSYSRYDLGQWDGWKMSGQARLHLPLSAYSRAQKTIAQIRTETYFDHDMGQFSNFNYTIKFDYFLQSQTAALDLDVPLTSDGTVQDRAIRTTKMITLEHYIDLDVSLHPKYSFRPRVGIEESWYHESKAENLPSTHTTILKTQLGVEVKPIKALSMTLAVENQTKLANFDGNVAYGRPEDNKWMLITYASF